MQFSLPVPLKVKGRSDFDPQMFVDQIEGAGVSLSWEQAERCPCTNDSSEPRTDCTICGGRGFEWRDAQTIRGVVHAASEQPKWLQAMGAQAYGTILVSLRWEHNPANWDRYTLVDAVMPRSDVITRASSGNVDTLLWKCHPVAMTLVVNGKEQAQTVGVRHCRIVTAGGLGGAIRVEGTDFVVDSNGDIDWTLGVGLGTVPAAGDRYAVTYFTKPVYVVQSHQFAMRQQTIETKSPTTVYQALPVHVMAQLEWLLDREAP